uniref:DNA topoisomerase n=1 Tax=Sinocyclocheilus grahami TaxID=75366 RepID=A0A672RCY9_SINGR
MRTVLMVAEKPSLAYCSTRKGLNGATALKIQCKLDLLYYSLSLMFSNPKLNMVKFLQIVHITGAEVFGPVLFFECAFSSCVCVVPSQVLDAIQPVMNKSYGNECTIYRAKFSSITDTDICNAMTRLGEPNKNEALSVDARQELDLRIGCAFTRFQTKYFQGKYGSLDSSLISFGPCQTPTLGFCVERHDKIQSFKPEAYWVVQAKVSSGKDRPLTLDWDRVRVFDRDVGQMFVNMAKTAKEAKVDSVTKKEKAKQRPIALNTVEMLRVASSALGMSPQHTMQIAEHLYTQGFISYPRTETTHYPENFDLKGTLKQQANSCLWGEMVKALLSEGINRPRKGVDAGDHPPITPMRAASENELGTTVRLRIFTFTCLILKLLNGTCAMLTSEVIRPELLPCTTVGASYENTFLCKENKNNNFIPHFRLSTMMRACGVYSRSFVTLQLNHCHTDYFVGHLGTFLDLERGSYLAVYGRVREPSDFIKIILNCVPKMNEGLTGFEQHKGDNVTLRIGLLFFFNHPQAKPSRLHCSHCDETYSLPQNGAIKLYKELKCPLDEFELVLWTSGSRGKSYPVCPYCFSNPPFRDMKKGMGCNECTHPSCQHSLNSLGISQCVECETGVLVFDPTSGQKWRMACNKCNVVVHFFEQAHKVQVSQDSCDSCEASLVIVDFNKTRSPLPEGETQHTGCVFCDPAFQDLVELKHATMRHPMLRAGGARRGKGRGRRPMGNPKKPKDKMAALAAYFV